MSQNAQEMTENEFASLLSKSKDVIVEYVMAHPHILYKGIPVVAVLCLAWPLIFTFWSWLPWMWASYLTYTIIPKGTFSLVLSIFKDNNWLLESLSHMNPTA